MNNTILWSPGLTLAEMEKLVIQKTYAFFRHNKTAAANALGISTRTLDNKLIQYEKENQQEQERQVDDQRKRTEFLARQRGLGQLPDNVGLPKTPQSTQAPSVSSTTSGVHVESVANSAEKQPMPVPERKEVQTMLPQSTAKNDQKRTRG